MRLALRAGATAALKALGYNLSIGWHYLKWALVIGAMGVVIRLAAGAWLGHLIVGLYNKFSGSRNCSSSMPFSVVIGATRLTLFAAAAGARHGRGRRCATTAEAMRPAERRPAIAGSVSKRR